MQTDRAGEPFGVTPQERQEMIAVAAYYLAESRGFPGGGALDDWINAERQILQMLERVRSAGSTRHSLDRMGLRNALHLWGESEIERK